MSGLEIAGVVLAVVPLTIKAAEEWSKIAKAAGSFATREIRTNLQSAQSDLDYYRIYLKRHLQALLSSATDDPDEIKQLIEQADHKDPRWRRLDQWLEGELDREAYRVYIDQLLESKRLLAQLENELCVKQLERYLSAGPCHDPRTVVRYLDALLMKTRARWTLAEFVRNSNKREQIIVQLNQSIDRMVKILPKSLKHQSAQPSHIVRTPSTNAMAKAYQKVTKQASILFQALHKAWSCPCQHDHVANLKLEHRKPSQIYFEILLLFAASAIDHCSWRPHRVQCRQTETCSCTPNAATPTTPIKAAMDLTAQVVPLRPAQRSKALVRKPLSDVRVTFATNSTPCAGTTEAQFDLCKVLRTPTSHNCIAVVTHEWEHYHLIRSETPTGPESVGTEAQTLSKLLSASTSRRLTIEERCYIALLTASSVAQLHSTPWMQGKSLMKDQILLHLNHDLACSTIEGDPFVQRTFGPDIRPGTNEAVLYTLGVLLTELCFDACLEDQPCRQVYDIVQGPAKLVLDCAAAKEWTKSMDEKQAMIYKSAVTWCLDARSTEAKTWRQDFIANVVEPLETSYESLMLSHFTSDD